MSAVLFCSSSSRVVLLGSIEWGGEALPLAFLVDFGADNSFLDAKLAQQAGLPLERLPKPKTVLDLDG